MSKLDPEECARLIALSADELKPEGWTAEDWVLFWRRMAQECARRLEVTGRAT